MRILISSYAFSPFRGSECAVGWNIAKELAKMHDVTVITGDVTDKEDEYIRYCQQNGPVPHLHVEYVRPTRSIMLIEKMHHIPGLWALYYVAYRKWQKLAYKRAKELHAVQPFDAVHHLTMIGFREPGYMWKLGIPFFWGPVGGGPNEPLAYWRLFSAMGCVKVFLRTVLNEIQKRLSRRAHLAARTAVKIWTVTSADYVMVHDLWGLACEKMVETGTVLRSEARMRSWDGCSEFKIVWSGIHTSRKALPILLYALAKLLPKFDVVNRIRVDVLGEGPETASWKRLAESLGVARCLHWHGHLEHDKALEVMNSGHVFAFPSLKEGTPHVVLEAISLGLPVICHDACGMGTVVDERCGMKVPMRGPTASIDGFGAAIERFLTHHELVGQLSKGSLARAKSLTWEDKAANISRDYIEKGGRA